MVDGSITKRITASQCAKIHDRVVGKFASVGRPRRGWEGSESTLDTTRAQRPRFRGPHRRPLRRGGPAAPTLPGGCPPQDETPGPAAAAPWSDSPDVTPCPSRPPVVRCSTRDHASRLARHRQQPTPRRACSPPINSGPCPSHSQIKHTASSRKHLLCPSPRSFAPSTHPTRSTQLLN
jgi:hypothetical protein